MTELIDQAQALEQLFRDRALANHKHNQMNEMPDEDEDGTRYCLSCGIEIPRKRLEAQSNAVRCVSCQSEKEPRQCQTG
jgi:DnaK suppressor protein